MRLIKLFATLLLLAPTLLCAQVSISASNVTDAFYRPLASAKLCFTPVNAAEQPSGFRVGSTQVVPNTVCGLVSNGVLQSGLTLAPSPTGLYYHIWAANRTTNAVIADYGMTPITGTSWTLDSYTPSMAVLPVSAIQVGSVSELPSSSSPTATISGSGPFLLNLGIPQGAQGIQGVQGAQGPAGGLQPSTYANLPSASGHANTVYLVTDATSASTCNAGGGIYQAICASNGTTWGPLGGGALPPGVAGDGNNGLAITGQVTAASVNGTVYLKPSGDTTGVQDNAAIVAAIATGKSIRLSAGSYYFTGNISITAPRIITGDGAANTFVYMTSASNELFIIHYGGGQTNNESLGSEIAGFSVLPATGVTPASGAYVLDISGVDSTHYLSGVRIHDIDSFGTCGLVKTGSYLISDWIMRNHHLNFSPVSGCSAIYYNTPTPGGDIHIEDNEFSGNGAPITIVASDSTWIVNNKLNWAGIVFTRAAITEWVKIFNNSIEGQGSSSGCGIDFGSGGLTPTGVFIFGGQIDLWQHALCNSANTSGLQYMFQEYITVDHSTSTITTNIVSGGSSNGAQVTSASQTAVALGNAYYNAYTGGMATFNLPTISSVGTGACFTNYIGQVQPMQLQAPSGGLILYNGANASYLQSAGAAGDSVCVTAATATQYVATNATGTWANGALPSPTFSPAPGPFISSVNVTLSDTTSGATIGYTTDGSTPTASGGTITAGNTYSAPFALTATASVNAIASKSGIANSSVSSAAYTKVQTFDTFGGTSGTALTSHTDAGGNSWTTYSYDTIAGATATLNGSGAVLNTHTGATSDVAVLNSLAPASADYTVSTTFNVASGSAYQVTVLSRALSTAFTGVLFVCTNTISGCQLQQEVSGTNTNIGGSTYALTWANGATHTLSITTSGTTVSAAIDGTTVLTGTTTVAAANQGGFQISSGSNVLATNYFLQ